MPPAQSLASLTLRRHPVAVGADVLPVGNHTVFQEIGQGVADTAKGVGKTVVGGAEVAGDKIKEAGEAAKPKATNAWESVRDGTVSFGRSVKTFFTTLFDKSPKRNEVRTETGSSSSTQ